MSPIFGGDGPFSPSKGSQYLNSKARCLVFCFCKRMSITIQGGIVHPARTTRVAVQRRHKEVLIQTDSRRACHIIANDYIAPLERVLFRSQQEISSILEV